MDGSPGGLEDLKYIPKKIFYDTRGNEVNRFEDKVKNWRGEALTESDLNKILTPLKAGDSRQIDAVNELRFLHDCREYGPPEYSLEVMNL